MAAPPPPPRGGMSLYANLLDPGADSSATIARAPVLFKQEDGSKDDAPRKTIDPALRFQPIRRPQAKQPSKAAKPIVFPKAVSVTATTSTSAAESAPAAPAPAASGASASPAPPARSTLADWAATEEDEYLYGTATKQRQRGGRRRKKKRLDEAAPETDWDELYDPARPTNVEEYLRSDERVREVREWKAVLYAHRRNSRRRGSYGGSEVGTDEEEEEEEEENDGGRPVDSRFAPPASLLFAPPPMSPPRVPPEDGTGDDAYARRMVMASSIAPPAPAGAYPAPQQQPPPPPPADESASSATISRAPVRYEAPPAQPMPPPTEEDAMDVDEPGDSDDDEVDYSAIPPPPPTAPTPATDAQDGDGVARSNRPGQAGFARRLMAKYGWTAGSGLGAEGDGITSALRVQVEKRRRRPDAEGGGFAEPGARGKIIGGKAAKKTKKKEGGEEEDGEGEGEGEEQGGKFGRMSEVVVLRNMLENMPDLAAEVEAGLGQEIGEECGDKYGRVERLFIDVAGRQVFIKFTDQVSALRAVNALQGRVFNGNAIAAKFYDADKFEKGIYG